MGGTLKVTRLLTRRPLLVTIPLALPRDDGWTIESGTTRCICCLCVRLQATSKAGGLSLRSLASSSGALQSTVI